MAYRPTRGALALQRQIRRYRACFSDVDDVYNSEVFALAHRAGWRIDGAAPPHLEQIHEKREQRLARMNEYALSDGELGFAKAVASIRQEQIMAKRGRLAVYAAALRQLGYRWRGRYP